MSNFNNFSDEELKKLAKSGNQIAFEILRSHTIQKKYNEKIEKLYKKFPNMGKDEKTITEIFHFGKVEAYKEFIQYLKDIEENTLLESLENAIKKETKQN